MIGLIEREREKPLESQIPTGLEILFVLISYADHRRYLIFRIWTSRGITMAQFSRILSATVLLMLGKWLVFLPFPPGLTVIINVICPHYVSEKSSL